MINIKYVLVGIVFSLFVAWHYWDVSKAVGQVHQEYAAKVLEQEARAKEEKALLVAEQQKEREKKNAKINSINAQLSNALGMLSLRKERPKDSGKSPNVGEACTGGSLFKEDGEFLAREAARADEVVAERDYYYSQYENTRLMIQRINNGK